MAKVRVHLKYNRNYGCRQDELLCMHIVVYTCVSDSNWGTRDAWSSVPQLHFKHMYSIAVVKCRVPNPPTSDQPFSPPLISL